MPAGASVSGEAPVVVDVSAVATAASPSLRVADDDHAFAPISHARSNALVPDVQAPAASIVLAATSFASDLPFSPARGGRQATPARSDLSAVGDDPDPVSNAFVPDVVPLPPSLQKETPYPEVASHRAVLPDIALRPGFLRLLANASKLSFGAPAPTPLGYYDLCMGRAAVCQPSRGWLPNWTATSGVHLDDRRLAQLVAVNAEVNRSIRQAADQALYGTSDRWVVGPRAGDCEDFALTKKAKLLALGWPSSALLIASATTSSGREHVVLIGRTDRGDVVLDSLVGSIRGWQPKLYRWQSIQSPTSPWTWNAIAPPPSSKTAVAAALLQFDTVNAVAVFE
jgi:predicted transglutaminase-like cysteine proteinase